MLNKVAIPEMPFPRRPLLDRIIVREIPIEQIYQGSELEPGLDDARRNDRTDRGIVVAISNKVDDVAVGDTVFFDEFSLSDPVFLNPADKHRAGLPRYWQIRVGDLKGVAVNA